MKFAKLFKPWTWCKPEPSPDSERALETEAKRYDEAMATLKHATAELDRSRSRSLDELEQRVQNADGLMREAFGRRRLPSGSG